MLEQYARKYSAPKTGVLTFARDNNTLVMNAGCKSMALHPESERVFFTTDRDLTFEFVKEGTKVTKVVVREHGAIVEEAIAD